MRGRILSLYRDVFSVLNKPYSNWQFGLFSVPVMPYCTSVYSVPLTSMLCKVEIQKSWAKNSTTHNGVSGRTVSPLCWCSLCVTASCMGCKGMTPSWKDSFDSDPLLGRMLEWETSKYCGLKVNSDPSLQVCFFSKDRRVTRWDSSWTLSGLSFGLSTGSVGGGTVKFISVLSS